MKARQQSKQEDAAAAESKAKKPLTRKVIRRIPPGHWLKVKWIDGPDSVVLLLRKPDRDELELRIWDPEASGSAPLGEHRVEFDQVLADFGQITIPAVN